MNGLALKLAMGNARAAGSGVGSLFLPEAQEKRVFAKLDAYRDEVRNLQKAAQKGSRTIAFGLGASAVATLAAGVAVVWAAHQRAKSGG